jgi:uncharacterized protein YjbI with pentapeptide repeats
MANQEHLDILKQGVEVWNRWRKQHSDVKPDLRRADLSGADLNRADLNRADLIRANLSQAHLSKIDLSKAHLSGADLSGATLIKVDFGGADLSGADLRGAYLSEAHLNGANLGGAHLGGVDLIRSHLSGAHLCEANLSGARLNGASLVGADLSRATLIEAELIGTDLSGASLREADLSYADFSRASLREANLIRAKLVGTNLTEANLTNCAVYGISVWDVQLQGTMQFNLVITHEEQPTITVDNLEVAQFIYLLLNNAKIRDVINTITTKVVLILGRFTPARKAVLDTLRDALRTQNFLPILFDFEKPNSRNLTETVKTLAHLARFIIADLTDPSSIPQELQAIIPTLAVPVQPILQEAKREYAMFVDFRIYPWVLPVHIYRDQTDLLTTLEEYVIVPAEQKAQELEKR